MYSTSFVVVCSLTSYPAPECQLAGTIEDASVTQVHTPQPSRLGPAQGRSCPLCALSGLPLTGLAN